MKIVDITAYPISFTIPPERRVTLGIGTATKRDLATQLNANTVSLMTGSFGSTYAQVGADLASVLDNGTNLRILPD